jgi:hypothetical protein
MVGGERSLTAAALSGGIAAFAAYVSYAAVAVLTRR